MNINRTIRLFPPLRQPMRTLRNPPPQNLPIFQNRNVRILRIVANRYARSAHLLLHRYRVFDPLFSVAVT